MRKRILAGLVGVGVLLVADQAVLYLAMSEGTFLGHDLAPFSPPLYSEKQRALLTKYEDKLTWPAEKYLADSLFDSELGWAPRPNQVRRTERFDWTGGRIGHQPLPKTKATGTKRIALFGCSYTYGSEVGPKQSWAALMDEEHADVEFANMGVPGYGMDQAYLRFMRDGTALDADEVWLGYFPGAALRVTSRFPPLFSRWRSLTVNFKPCFQLDAEGALELLPCPVREPRDTPRLLRNPKAFADAMNGKDLWIERSPWAFQPLGDHWSHQLASGRLALTMHERMGRDASEHLIDSDGEVYQLNLAILLTFAKAVEASGARFRLIIMPSTEEIRVIGADGEGFWDGLVQDLREKDVEVHDLARDLNSLSVVPGKKHWMPQGHYSPHGNQLVADCLERAFLASE